VCFLRREIFQCEENFGRVLSVGVRVVGLCSLVLQIPATLSA
jgi:hypothetical protein